MTEIYKPIPSFPGYEASNLGHIKVNGISVGTGKTHDGYQRISLKKNSKWYSRTVHVLVAEAFLGPRPEGLDVCHNDGRKTNNRISNLRYDTRKNNVADVYSHGRGPLGKRNGLSKLTEAAVLEIRRLRKLGVPVRKLAKQYGVNKSNISQITLRQTWKWLDEPNSREGIAE